METKLPNIPDEIILVHILSILPAESLVRFRCVCKRWLDWISDPQFKYPTKRRRRILVLSKLEKKFRYSDCIPCINYEDCSIERISQPWRKEELPVSHRVPLLFRFLGSCNGFLLVCLGSSVFLWNPSTRTSVEVIKYKILLHPNRVMSALCYDSSTDDYKFVISLMKFLGVENYVCDTNTPVKFCSLRKKYWTEVYFRYYTTSKSSNYGTVVNGNPHWLANKWSDEGENWYEKTIIYFDACCDKFREVPFLDEYNKNDNKLCGLGALNGYLAFALCDSVGEVEMWVMQNYGVRESWSLFFKCSDFAGLESAYTHTLLNPLCVTKDGEILMLKDLEEIVAYSPQKNLVRSITKKNEMGVASYVETLVSPVKMLHRRK